MKARRLPVIPATVIFLLVVGAVVMVVTTIANLLHFRDVGYPESANLLRVREFLLTGQMYPDFDRPPYLVTLYGPVFYIFLGAAYKLASLVAVDPQIICRLVVIASFCASLIITFRIGQRLYPAERRGRFLSLFFAISIASLSSWTTQIRGDLLALALSLSSFYIYLIATNQRQRVFAAICAGVALLIKQTFIAAPCAILIWLLCRREVREGLVWIAVVALTVVCGYAVAFLREPLLYRHLAILGSPILEFRGAFGLIGEAFSQPQALFGCLGIVLAVREGDYHKLLFGCYCCTSWLVALLTILHVGGDANYFWEPMLVSAITAGPGLVWFIHNVNPGPTFLKVFTAILLVAVFSPVLKTQIFQMSGSYGRLRTYDHAQAEWQLFLSRISGRHLLSTFPDITIRGRIPEIPDPFLNNVLSLEGRWNFTPVLRELRTSKYELVVVSGDLAAGGSFHRGIGIWSPEMWQVLRRNYVQTCVLQNMEVWLPRSNSSSLLKSLSTSGCEFTSPVRARQALDRTGWIE